VQKRELQRQPAWSAWIVTRFPLREEPLWVRRRILRWGAGGADIGGGSMSSVGRGEGNSSPERDEGGAGGEMSMFIGIGEPHVSVETAVVATELNESDLERAKGPISEGLGCSMVINSGSRGIGGVFRDGIGTR